MLEVDLSILWMNLENGFEEERNYESRVESMPELVRVTAYPCTQTD